MTPIGAPVNAGASKLSEFPLHICQETWKVWATQNLGSQYACLSAPREVAHKKTLPPSPLWLINQSIFAGQKWM